MTRQPAQLNCTHIAAFILNAQLCSAGTAVWIKDHRLTDCLCIDIAITTGLRILSNGIRALAADDLATDKRDTLF